MTKPRIAIVLFNLGGPDRPESIRPFLLKLFSDPAILRVNRLLRPFVARAITRARLGPAMANYARIGGRSGLLEMTERQGRALEAELPELEARCFVAMRYWHPTSQDAAEAVRRFKPDEILLLPLYPHYSTTTTGSSLAAWQEAAVRAGLMRPTTALCCYYADAAFTDALSAILQRSLAEARQALPAEAALRVLFSAHGLPQTIVDAGDPYQFQIERSVAAIVQRLAVPGLDHAICYQSRATPVQWLGPSTEAEIERAGRDGIAVLVVPIAFTAEHVETLVELDIEYRELAAKVGVPQYFRAPAPDAEPAFTAALATLVRRMHAFGPGLCSSVGGRTCPGPHTDCPFARADPAEREALR